MFEDIDAVISNNERAFKSFFIDAIEQKNFDLLQHLVEKYGNDHMKKNYLKEGFFLSVLKGDEKIIDYLYKKYKNVIVHMNFMIKTAMWNDDVNVFKKIINLFNPEDKGWDLLNDAIVMEATNIFKFLIEEYNLINKDTINDIVLKIVMNDRLDMLKYVLDKIYFTIDSNTFLTILNYNAFGVFEYFEKKFPEKAKKILKNIEIDEEYCYNAKLALFYARHKKWNEKIDYLIGVEDLKNIHEELKNDKDFAFFLFTHTSDPQKKEYLYTNFIKDKEEQVKNIVKKSFQG